MSHLHVHTSFSPGDGLASPKELAKAAEEMGHSSLAITDHDNMSGMLPHNQACKNIKPIYGVELTLHNGRHITLLARNNKGLSSLYKLMVSQRTHQDMRKHSDGVIALSGDFNSEISTHILKREFNEASKTINIYKSIYGDDFYLETVGWDLEEFAYINKMLKRASSQCGVPCVWTNDVHYIKRSDYIAHSVLVCDKVNRRASLPQLQYHIPSEAWFKPTPDCPYIKEIEDKCNVNIEEEFNTRMPQYDPPAGHTEDSFLRELVFSNLPIKTEEYQKRAAFELDVISRMGFPGYFLIVWDFIKWAHNNGVPVGPGRGSGAGSIVAWSLGITGIDPVKYDLPFERFLNPERVSLPDFDIDFGIDQRDDVIKYVVEKYTNDYVAQIGTFSMLKVRSSWQAACKVLRVPRHRADAFSRSLPQGPYDNTTLEEMFDEDGELLLEKKYPKTKSMLELRPEYKPLLAIARKLEGAQKTVGRHAAGVLISRDKIYDSLPLYHAEDISTKKEVPVCKYVSQTDKDDSEKLGVVKFDFLGLCELDVIEKALEYIDDEIDIESIPMDDEKVFKMLSRGHTMGVFQLSGSGMTSFIQELRPTEFEDIVAITSLYRPGPKDANMHTVYARRKNGLEAVTYLHPDLQEVLGKTYGVIVYQEQVMAIARLIAGYTLGGADKLRRAIGKKKVKEMERHKNIFFQGGIDNGYSPDLLNELWMEIETFSRYGFNRSHAVSYSMISYRTAWLKANYPEKFMAAQLEVRKKNYDQVQLLVYHAKHEMGLEVIDPDVMISPAHCKGADGKIYIGISSLKQMRPDTAHSIEINQGNFSDIESFFKNVRKMNLRCAKALVGSGALDSLFGEDLSKPEILNIRDMLYTQIKPLKERKEIDETESSDMGWLDILEMERNFLGRYRSGHPTEIFAEWAKRRRYGTTADVTDFDAVYSFLGIITRKFETLTKNEKPMCFINVEDAAGELDITVFPDDYQEPSKFDENTKSIKAFTVRTSEYNGKLSMHLLSMEELNEES